VVSESKMGENNPMYGKDPWNKGISKKDNPLYGREQWSTEQKNAIRERMMGSGNPMYGKDPWNKGKKLPPLTDECKEKMSRSLTGKTHTEETKRKISDSHTGKKLSEETKKKLSILNMGKKLSEETKKKMSESRKGVTHKLATCPHCGKTGGHSAMHRWHFNNCRTC